MTRKPKTGDDDLLAAMRRAIMAVLDDKDADVTDRMKAIEAAAKILTLEHKIREKRGTARGSFFAAPAGETD